MKRSHENPSPDKTESSTTSAARDENGFLGRWSRRKRNAEVLEQEVPESSVPAEATPDELSNAELTNAQMLTPTQDNELQESIDSIAEESLPEAPLTDADMPDIETLNADSDFSPFFSEGVSKELRNLALKKLFFSGKFSARDGLDDYDDDFTKFEPLGDTVTSDMKFHARRKEKARLAELEEQRLLQESEEAQAIEDANAQDNAHNNAHNNEVATTDSNTDENSVAEKSEQELADTCEPAGITSDHSEQPDAGKHVDENADPVALEDAENTVRTPKG